MHLLNRRYISSTLYVSYVMFFLKRRRELNAKQFALSASNQSSEVQLIQGMVEIKLNNCEQSKRWEWEKLQVKRFKLSMSNLQLQQWQQFGSGFIYELKSILISFWAAKEVIDGNMTLGMMMATQQILGQLDAPIMQFVSFIQQAQDAKMSLERLGEIHNEKDEDNIVNSTTPQEFQTLVELKKEMNLQNVFFRYGNPSSDYILQNLNLTIPEGKTTAIVGESGSGKTTLIKLLLKFYAPEKGTILVGNTPLETINSSHWRKKNRYSHARWFCFF